jgi:hypothetical protein
MSANFVGWAQHVVTHHSLSSSFWFNENDSHPPPYLLTRPRPCDFFLFPKMKLKLKGWCFVQWRDLGQTAGCDGANAKMTSSIPPDHGNPAGISVLTQKGTTSKEMETNKMSISS